MKGERLTSELTQMLGSHVASCPFESVDGRVKLVINHEDFDYHIRAGMGYHAQDFMRAEGCAIQHYGLELMPFEECEPDVTRHGAMLFWLVPQEPV